MRARRFEDLYFWQKARELSKTVYRISGKSAFEVDKDLREIFRHLSCSIMGEIAFGFAQGTNTDFKESLDIARGDLMRIKSLSYLAQDLGYLMDDELEEIHACITDVDRLMMGFIRGMRSNRRDYHDPDGHLDDYDDSEHYSSNDDSEHYSSDEQETDVQESDEKEPEEIHNRFEESIPERDQQPAISSE